MEFEWDENKRKSNRKKHEMDFLRASKVFKDENRVERIDDRKNYGEVRIQAIGRINKFMAWGGTIIFVVYTVRNNNIRIISARKANKGEKGVYHGNS
ncbi:MAG: BrnT family toxin [Proteobacteria bacterium]|nr:BrnT family toxin [Pseudomonadota bacterium]